ncbi:ABC transporter permease [Virgibacillus sp. CBA3643]|uniref:ABC transporter permease n=1 Tax=Virgibacillus sp. CBA3643 TaxID=2942278 RepID=UPI0035A3D63F
MESMQQTKTHKDNNTRIKELFFNYGVVIALILLIVILTILTQGIFIQSENLINLLQQVSVNALLAIGATFVILTAGIDLSVGSIVAFSGMIAASFVTGDDPNIILGIVFGLASGLLIGLINGFVIAKWKVAPFIATLGMMAIARGATYIYSDGQPISNLSSSYLLIGGGKIFGIPISVLITILVTIIFMIFLYKIKFGRYVFALGGNEQAAKISGLKVNRIKIAVYSISGLLAGLGGIILSSRVTAGLPQAGASYELDAIAAVIIGGTSLMGGKGRLWGTLVGVLIIGILNNGLDILGVSSYWKDVVKGTIIIAAVMIDRKTD